MRPFLFVALMLGLAGCATTRTAPALPPTHPAHADAPATAYVPPANVLAADAALAARQYDGASGDMAGMDHAAMGHTMADATDREANDHAAMDHAAMGHTMTPAADEVAPMQGVLDAYLAIGNALAADQTTGIAAQATAFLAALDRLTAAPPAGQPHFWHQRPADLETLRTHGRALAAGPALADARIAYGHLSDALARIVAATAVPAAFGQPVFKMACGMMRGVPEGGVWLQLGDDTRNPYFGSRMLKCVSSKEALPVK